MIAPGSITGPWKGTDPDGIEHEALPPLRGTWDHRSGGKGHCSCGWEAPRVVDSDMQCWADGKAHVRGMMLKARRRGSWQRRDPFDADAGRLDEVGTPELPFGG